MTPGANVYKSCDFRTFMFFLSTDKIYFFGEFSVVLLIEGDFLVGDGGTKVPADLSFKFPISCLL